MASWEDTAIWKILSSRAPDSAVVTTVRNALPEIEMVLSSGSTTPLRFTLHDHNHSYRVAERMRELLPDTFVDHADPIEFGFLLLAAYLHDIGMSARSQVVI